MHPYVAEEFTPEEATILRRYMTNLDQPVFALVNLPEVVKGALFARYSRSSKSLRRLFLDEFVGELDITGDETIDATVGVDRAEQLYERVFLEYGDDSVAQLGGVHLACEQASNMLTKVLEWGRLMSYLEQSTRYIAYDTRGADGRYRYFRDPDVLDSPMGARYVGEIDRLFDTYASLLAPMNAFFAEAFPKQPGDSDFVWRTAVKAKAFDAVRGILPAAAQSNVGIYGTGQGYEQLLLRMRAHPLPEARSYADLMLTELRKVIPSFLTRVDLPDRGGAWSSYLATNRVAMDDLAQALFGEEQPDEPDVTAGVRLVDFDPDAENKVLAGMLWPHTSLPEHQVLDRVERMTTEERLAVVAAYGGVRTNRRHKPGRALELTSYRFDVLADYGAFRDLQRHRLLTIDWQPLGASHGYDLPRAIVDAGQQAVFADAMDRSRQLHDDLADHGFPAQASYAVALAYRVRFSMTFNAREAMHLLELRTGPQGHPSYRRVCQEMHRLIADQAGHKAIAAMMSFVDYGDADTAGLERLEAERRSEARRAARG